ncbi:MAG: FecR domain-containing protein [Rhodospirillales bacterium]|nr:FecR domain-containing protein [Alphaproteobacteria bacterium]MCB9977765.1 FecR domain-containing protein [Rhodospirillales bacterium]
MAYEVIEDFTEHTPQAAQSGQLSLHIDGAQVELPDSSFVRDADMSRDGQNLVLNGPHGTVVVEDYFAQATPPALVSPDGAQLTPELVHSFLKADLHYADNSHGMTDVSPIGAVQEIKGEATVTRVDGKVEVLGVGSPIYQGDIIETSEDGAVNVMFMDESTFAVSSDARLAIDEYVFDPATQAGSSDFSVLKGVFVFTSGLIGRDDPDDVHIDTPSGSIGIRGTIIMGNVDTGEITVVEGAIVLTDYEGHSVTLSDQFETAMFLPAEGRIDFLGKLSAEDVDGRYADISSVSSDLFSTIHEEMVSPEVMAQNNNSDLIMTDDVITLASNSHGLEANLVAHTVTENTAHTDTATQQVVASVVEQALKAPFTVTAEKFAFAENTNGALVARLTAHNTTFAVINLASVTNNFYDIVRESATTFLVSLKPGVSMDFEHPVNLIYYGTDAHGGFYSNISNLGITNVDEPTVLTGDAPNNLGTSNYFAASFDNLWHYDFSKAFYDPEHQVASYNVVSPPISIGIADFDFDASTGIMDIQFNNLVDGSNHTFTVQALDSASGVLNSITINFDTIIQTNFTGVMALNNETFSSSGTVNDTVTVISNNNNVFSDAGNDIISVAGNNNKIMAGDGDDTITLVSGNNNFMHGGAGHDTFVLNAMQLTKAYGGDDSDYFRLTAAAITDLQTFGAGLIIDGGDDNLSTSDAGDTLIMDSAGNIDFTSIADTIIKNIESIKSDNGLANVINLDYASVLAMTDDNHILIVNMDGNDTLNFTNGSGNTFYSAGQTDNAGETYNVYTDGIVTLLVDTEAATVTGV